MPAERKSLSPRALAVLLTIVALWGGNTVAVSFSVDSLPPVGVACVRFVLGAIVLFFWCRIEGTPLRATRRELLWSTVAGVLMFSQIATFNVAVGWTNSTHGVILINTFIFWVAVIEHFFTRHDRLTPQRLFGLVLAAIGVVFVTRTRDSAAVEAGESYLAGDLVLITSAFLLALRVLYVRRVVQDMKPSKLMFWHDLVGIACFAVWSLGTESYQEAQVTNSAVLGILYQGLIVSGICFVAHASLLERYSASQVSVFSFLTPVFGVVFSVLLRGEPFTGYVIFGALFVVAGIWLVSVRR